MTDITVGLIELANELMDGNSVYNQQKVANNGDISTCYQPFDSDIVEIQSMVEISPINQ